MQRHSHDVAGSVEKDKAHKCNWVHNLTDLIESGV
jgi:hypothetical protein